MSNFFRFPHTPHLAWLGEGSPRDDKVLSQSEVKQLLSGDVVVEEKLDGANIGFSTCEDGRLRIQNRGQYLESPYMGQFSRLNSWLAIHQEKLEEALYPNLILFGEWCAARHSTSYSLLPDWFLGFDIYEQTAGKFWSTKRRDQQFAKIGIRAVPQRFQGKADLFTLTQILADETSLFLDGPMEGLVIRKEDSDWLSGRAKLVRAEFTQAITEHWSRRGFEWNRIASH
jgi:ATP-dependent RNA circularization protein (DNA/RNA ligase family)